MKRNPIYFKHWHARPVFVLLLLLVVPFTFIACDDEESYGTPKITNIRVTDPGEANISLTEGSLGQMVVIQGENLASTTHVFFNNVEATFNPSFVTDNNIIVSVPEDFPTEINDMVRVVTLGGEATHSFPIDIPAPSISGFPLEWVPEGGILTIRGQYFYNVNSIEFTGGVSTTNFTILNPQTIEVIVPADAESGPVTVDAVAGSASSNAWFRDNRNMMVDFDENPICWGGMANVVDATAMPAGIPIDPISDNFYYIKKDYAANSWWIEETVIAYCGGVTVTGPKSDFALTFEMYVGASWEFNWFEVEMFGDNSDDPVYFEWRGFDILGGEDKVLENTGWMTVRIPLSAMENLGGSTYRMGRFGSYKAEAEDTIEFAFDNFRFTPLN